MGSQQYHKATKTNCVSKFLFFLVGLSIGVTSGLYILVSLYKLETCIVNQLSIWTTSPPSPHLMASSKLNFSTPYLLSPLPPPPPPPSPHLMVSSTLNFSSPLPPPPPPSPPHSLLRSSPPRPEHKKAGEKLVHDIDNDRELFWRASLVPYMKEYPFERTPKIAFLFLTRGPLPLAPLWEVFFKGNEKKYSIYVHTHPNYTDPMPEDSVFHNRRIPSKVVRWSDINVIDAERRLFASALLDYSNEKFVLLSESCIPLYNFTTIYNYLIIKHTNLSFVGIVPNPWKASSYRWRAKMNPPLHRSQWYKGSQWVVTDRVLSVDIVSDTEYHRVFRDYGSFQDEHYVQILVMQHYPERNSNWSVTWTEWTGHRHPTTFEPRSISAELIDRMRFRDNCTIAGEVTNMCYLFARKLAPHSIKRLMEISSVLFG